MRSKSRKFFDNCQVKNFNFSTFLGSFFGIKVEVSVPNFYFSSSSWVEKWMAGKGFLGNGSCLVKNFVTWSNHRNAYLCLQPRGFVSNSWRLMPFRTIQKAQVSAYRTIISAYRTIIYISKIKMSTTSKLHFSYIRNSMVNGKYATRRLKYRDS